MEKTHCHLPDSGSSWDSFPDPEDDAEDEAEDGVNSDTSSESSTRLLEQEMTLFGRHPAFDNFSLVTCKECGKMLKTPLFLSHCEKFHQSLVTAINAKLLSASLRSDMRKCIKTMQPKIEITRLRTSESMDVDIGDVKIEEAPIKVPKLNHVVDSKTSTEQGNRTTTINHILKKTNCNNGKKLAKDSPRKVQLTKDREYDPNRHCGVWVADMKKNCTRSLTCKTHALSLRRAVPGRCKEFDVLLVEHRERVSIEKERQQLYMKTQNQDGSDGGLSNTFFHQRGTFSNQGYSDGQTNKDISSNLAYKSQHSNLDEHEADLPYVNSHPRPLGCCKFGARRAGKGFFVFDRKSDHLRTTVLSMVERFLYPSQPRQNVGKHSVHRKYNAKTAGQSSNQAPHQKTDTAGRSRVVPNSGPTRVPTQNHTLSSATAASTVFRNSTKPKMARQTSYEGHHKTTKHVLVHNASATNAQGTAGVATQQLAKTTGEPSILETSGATDLESSLTLCKDLGIMDTTSPSSAAPLSTVILNGPIAGGDVLANHVQPAGVKNIAPAPSPRSYVVPASSASSLTFHKNAQAAGACGTQSNPLANGNASSPPNHPCNISGKTTLLNNKASLATAVAVTHSVANFNQAQTLVFANTNISQLQAQQINSPPVVTQTMQGKSQHAQGNVFQRPERPPNSPGRPACQTPSPGRQSPSNASPKYQHPLYVNHQVPTATSQAPIAQLKQQVENQNQQLQQIKMQQQQQQQQQQSQPVQQQQQTQRNVQQNKQMSSQIRTQARIAPAPTSTAQTYLLQQSQANHALSICGTNAQVLKTNAIFIPSDSPQREIQFAVSRNTQAANTVG